MHMMLRLVAGVVVLAFVLRRFGSLAGAATVVGVVLSRLLRGDPRS
jgi:hypothetical protein